MEINVAPQRVWQVASALDFRVPGASDVGALPLGEPIVHGKWKRRHLLRLALPGRALVDVLPRGALQLSLPTNRGGGHRSC